jgi:peptide/nickel transport system permease protein
VLGYVVRRLLASAAVVVAVTFAVFVLFFRLGEDPGVWSVGQPNYFERVNKAAYAKYQARLDAADHALGTDEPVPVQYVRYLQRVVHGDLGNSFVSHQPISSLLVPAFRTTAVVALGGLVLLLLIALPIALLSALRPGSIWDRLSLVFLLLAASMPPFLLAVLLLHTVEPRVGLTYLSNLTPSGTGFLIVGSFTHQPIAGYCPIGGFPHVPGGQVCNGPIDWARHLLMPWIGFAFALVAVYARTLRAGLMQTLDEPYVRTARAKGATELVVLRRHVLRPLLPQLSTMLAMDLGAALGIVLYVETVFQIPGVGLGTYAAAAAQNPGVDLPYIAGVVLVTAVIVVVLNLVADLVSAWLDPRIRLTRSGLRV